MTRSISSVSLIVLTLSACGLAPQDGTTSPEPGGYSFGSTGDADTDTDADTDVASTDTDADTDTVATDSGADTSSESCMVMALLGIIPQTEWDPSVVSPDTVNPEFSLWNVANDTTPDYEGYGVASGAKTSSNGYITVAVEYCPGDVLVVGGYFFDGYRDRWLAEANGVVNILPDADVGNAKRIVIDFGDGNWQGYRVGGAMPSEGEAGWVDNGGGGGDLKVATYNDVATHDDSL